MRKVRLEAITTWKNIVDVSTVSEPEAGLNTDCFDFVSSIMRARREGNRYSVTVLHENYQYFPLRVRCPRLRDA